MLELTDFSAIISLLWIHVGNRFISRSLGYCLFKTGCYDLIGPFFYYFLSYCSMWIWLTWQTLVGL